MTALSAERPHLGLFVVLELHLLQVLGLPGDVHVVGSSLNARFHNWLTEEPTGAKLLFTHGALERTLV